MGTFKAIAGIVLIVACVYSGFQVIPPEFKNYSFQDDLKEIAMVGGANPNRTDSDLRDQVLSKAREHDIELRPEQVTVQRIGTPGNPAVYVGVDYSVPVNLPGYSFDMHFTPSSGNKGF